MKSKKTKLKTHFNTLCHWPKSSLDVGYNLASRTSKGYLFLSISYFGFIQPENYCLGYLD